MESSNHRHFIFTLPPPHTHDEDLFAQKSSRALWTFERVIDVTIELTLEGPP